MAMVLCSHLWDKMCNILICVAVIFSFSSLLKVEKLSAWEVSTFAIMLLECLLVVLFSHKTDTLKDNTNYRPDVEPSLMCVFLVPLCVLSETFSMKSKDDSNARHDDTILSICSACVVISKYFFLLGRRKVPVLILSSMCFAYIFVFGHFSVLLFSGMSAVVIWKYFDWIPKAVPKSFSFAEMSICLQLSLFVLWRILRELLKTEYEYVIDDEERFRWIGATAVTSILIATAVIWLLKAHRSVVAFLFVYTVFAILSVTFLTIRFSDNLLSWILRFLKEDCTLAMLLLSWVLLFAITVIWTFHHALQLSQSRQMSEYFVLKRESKHNFVDTSVSCRERRKEFAFERDKSGVDDLESDWKTSKPQVSFNTRKVFHLLILLVYVPGLLIAPHILSLAASIAFGVFIVLEASRVFKVPWVGHHLDHVLRTFVDERDQGVLFLTHIYLLVGLSLPLWMTLSPLHVGLAPIKVYSGVLSLGIGDTVACVAGRAFGQHRWKGTKKTMEGTLSSIVAQWTFIYTIAYLGILPEFSHIIVLSGVVHGGLFEAFTDQIDNLVLPLALFPFLCLI